MNPNYPFLYSSIFFEIPFGYLFGVFKIGSYIDLASSILQLIVLDKFLINCTILRRTHICNKISHNN